MEKIVYIEHHQLPPVFHNREILRITISDTPLDLPQATPQETENILKSFQQEQAIQRRIYERNSHRP